MQQEIPGFKILMIRDVPMGMVLNKDTADDYPLIDSGSWVSDNGRWMIQKSWVSSDQYELIPFTQKAMKTFFTVVSEITGSIPNILEAIQKLDYYYDKQF